jgi:hypothetical protein
VGLVFWSSSVFCSPQLVKTAARITVIKATLRN